MFEMMYSLDFLTHMFWSFDHIVKIIHLFFSNFFCELKYWFNIFIQKNKFSKKNNSNYIVKTPKSVPKSKTSII